MKNPRAIAIILATALTFGGFGSTGLVASAAERDEVWIGEEGEIPELLGTCYTLSDGVLTLKGNVDKNEIEFYVSSASVKKIVAAEGTVLPQDSSGLFAYYSNCEEIDLSNANTSQVTNMYDLFRGDGSLTSLNISSFDTSKVTNMSSMFDGCHDLQTLDVSHFDTQNVESMKRMFFACSGLKTLDVSNFKTSKVTNMEAMFGQCSNLESLDLSSFDTSNVTTMEEMFTFCRKLKNLDFSGFDTSNVTSMCMMFYDVDSITVLDLSHFNTSNVTNMRAMFKYSDAETLNLGGFDTGNVTESDDMFAQTANLRTLILGKRFETISTNMGLDNGYGWIKGDDATIVSGNEYSAEIINSEKTTYHKIKPIEGSLVIEGDCKCGSTLTAKITDSNVNDFVYQWTRSDGNITGATKSTYKLGKDDIGHCIGCIVTSKTPWITDSLHDKKYENVTKADAPVAPNGLGAKAPSTLGGNDGQITGVNSTMEYSTDYFFESDVKKCTGSVIKGLKSGYYYVRIAETDTTYAGEYATVTVPDGNAVIILTGTVTITGNLKYNQTLKAQVSGSNATKFKYQWKRGTTAISGATNATYKLTKDDIGQVISCVVTDADGKITKSISGKTEEKIAKADGPAAPTGLNGVAPSEKGGSDGKITGVKNTMEYSTKEDFSSNVKNCPDGTITGLTEGIYYVRVKATATTFEGEATKVEVPAGVETTVTGTVTISGNPKYNQVLTVKVTDTNLSDMKYQWKRDGVAISGATASTYRTVKEDIGKIISCVITDGKGKLKGSITGKVTTKIGKLTGDDAPTGLGTVKPSVKGKADGQITGVKTTMEYATKSDFSDAKACTSTTITGLKAGTYYVRVKETETRYAGDAAKVVIKDGQDVVAISGKVSLSGALKFGQTLTAKVTDSNAKNFKYQWKRGTTAISGATASTYKLVKADIGQIITCVVTDADGKTTGSLSAKTTSKITKADASAAPNGLNGEAPSKKGAADGKITGVKTTMEYATKSDFSDAKACTSTTITGLKAGTYYVRVKETETRYAGDAAKVVIKDGPDVVAISGKVSLSGALKFGQTLTAKVTDSNAKNFKYQWKRGTTAISGATASTYKLVKADIGQIITCVVTDADGKTTGSLSAKTTSKITKADGPEAPNGLNGEAPSKKGAADGKITGVKTTMEYATKSDFSDAKACTSTTITGLKAGTYYVRVKETATTFAGNTAKVTVPEKAEEKVNISGTVTISGTLKYDQTLTAKVSGSNASKFKYQWKRGSKAISGATAATYKLAKADIGQTISCVVTDAESKKIGSISGKASAKVEKADGPAAPTGLKGVAPTKKDGNNGQITGVKTTMEYSNKSDFSANVVACTATTIGKLKAGTYYVRVKETEVCKAGKATKVVVPAYSDNKNDVTKIFKDVKAGEWYVNAIQFVYDKKYMNGVSGNTFGTNVVITREQFVTVLYNIEGKPSTKYRKLFKDVAAKQYYSEAVIWAYDNKITKGISDTVFGTGNNISREQLATMIYNYAQYKKLKGVSKSKDLSTFPDYKKVSTWAKEGLTWAVSNGVVNGKASNGKNYLDPQGKASRAECAQMIKNLFDNVIKK